MVPATTPSLLDPMVYSQSILPMAGGFCVRLGNDINGAESERMTYQINVVPPTAESIASLRCCFPGSGAPNLGAAAFQR